MWEAERADAREKQKLEELKKERDEEREKEELVRLQEESGLISKRPDRLDWMYSGSVSAEKAEAEDILTGKRRVDAAPVSRKNQLGVSSSKTQLDWQSGLSTSKIETSSAKASLNREDPMTTIKNQESTIVKQHVDRAVTDSSRQSRSDRSEHRDRYRSDRREYRRSLSPSRRRHHLHSRSRSPEYHRHRRNY